MTDIPTAPRHDWSRAEIRELMELPFPELMYRAQAVHRAHFDPAEVQLSTLLSIKTGACPEDCAYCPQSARYDTGLERDRLMQIEEVEDAARQARDAGASRFCMGAAWRSPRDKDLDTVAEMVRRVRDLGMETCLTAGMLSDEQTSRLREAGLDYYNHNLDTSPEFYDTVVTTRTYQERLDTLSRVREAGMKVCAGGILGMGESRNERAGLLQQLATLEPHPESVPINLLIQVEGTPLHGIEELDPIEFVRTIAAARIAMPASHVRLSAGREDMDDALQALCISAGANSIFYGEKLLTTGNADVERDRALFERLGLRPEGGDWAAVEAAAAAGA